MAFCPKCGAQVPDGVKFCTQCGCSMEGATQNSQQYQNTQQNNQYQQTNQGNTNGKMNDFADKIAGLNNTADSTNEFNPADVANNKFMAILAYLGFLVFVPMFAAPESKYARYHTNQGLLLFIVEVGYAIVQFLINVLLRVIFPWNWSYGLFGGRGPIYGLFSTILGLLWLGVLVLIILGIINAAQGRAKELPIIGKLRIWKY